MPIKLRTKTKSFTTGWDNFSCIHGQGKSEIASMKKVKQEMLRMKTNIINHIINIENILQCQQVTHKK